MGNFNVKPLRTERRPLPRPVDRIYGPPDPGATSHKVSTGEDWHSLSILYMKREDELIYYNFQTTVTDYVNWYLREYVGCRVPDARGMNWKFSSDAKPGIIWIPPRIIKTRDTTTVPKFPWEAGWGASLNIPSGGPHIRVLSLEIGHLLFAALEGIGVHGLLMFGGTFVAPFAASAAVLAGIGGAHMDGFAIAAKQEALSGYAIGAVLGAKGADAKFVQHNYMKIHYVDKKLQDVYNYAVAAGFLDGRKLNDYQVRNLFSVLHSRMQGQIPKGGDWDNWSDAQKRKYNDEAASVFKSIFLK